MEKTAGKFQLDAPVLEVGVARVGGGYAFLCVVSPALAGFRYQTGSKLVGVLKHGPLTRAVAQRTRKAVLIDQLS